MILSQEERTIIVKDIKNWEDYIDKCTFITLKRELSIQHILINKENLNLLYNFLNISISSRVKTDNAIGILYGIRYYEADIENIELMFLGD